VTFAKICRYIRCPKFAALALIVAPLAHSENWYVLQASDPAWAIDLDSLAISGPYRKAWIRQDFPEPQPLFESARLKPWNTTYQYALVLYYVDCAAKMLTSPQSVFYGPKDETVGNYTAKFNPDDLRDVAPGTMAQLTVNFVCHRPISGR
jgi:hypothetical protein